MTVLSVNINKIATIRNSRGGNLPNVLTAAVKCEEFGAQGITVHPRPDERHIRYQDARDIKPLLKKALGILNSEYGTAKNVGEDALSYIAAGGAGDRCHGEENGRN